MSPRENAWTIIVAFAARDLRARYRGTVFGYLWSLLDPLLTLAVFAVVFSVVVPLGIPRYPLFFLAGYLVWSYFQSGITVGSEALLNNADLIRKVPFPIWTVPIARALSGWVTFLVSLFAAVPFLAYYGIVPRWSWALLPVVAFEALVIVAGLSLLLAPLMVLFQDFRYLLSAGLRLLFYATPVFYDLATVPERFWGILLLNPIAPVIAQMRSLLLGTVPPPLWAVAWGWSFAAGVLVVGWFLFGRMQQHVVKQL